jgi:L-rhamnose mutarotase
MADYFKDQMTANEEDDIIVLYNEATDKDEEFYELATLDVDGKWYIVMKPVEELPDIADDEVLIYEIIEDKEGNSNFAAIEDEEVLQKVFNEFMEMLEEWEEEDNK